MIAEVISWKYIEEHSSKEIKSKIRIKQNGHLLERTGSRIIGNLQDELNNSFEPSAILIYRAINVLCAKKINMIDEEIQKKFFESIKKILNLKEQMGQTLPKTHEKKYNDKTHKEVLEHLYDRVSKKVTPRHISDLNFSILHLMAESELCDEYILRKMSNALLLNSTLQKIFIYFPDRLAIKVVERLIDKYKSTINESSFLNVPVDELIIDLLTIAILNNYNFIIPALIKNKHLVNPSKQLKFHTDFMQLKDQNKVTPQQLEFFNATFPKLRA